MTPTFGERSRPTTRRRFLRQVVGGAGALAALGGCRGIGSRPRPSILLITLDTTRADRLGVYGCERPTSPNLDRLARESVVYDRAIATSSWTLPSHASLFTGKFTTSHGARYDAEGPLRLASGVQEDWDEVRARGLSRGERTLAAILGDEGYATGGVVGGPWLKRIFGLDDGFQHYDDAEVDSTVGRRADRITDAALKWLRGREGQDFFLFLNYYDAHGPYSAPEPFRFEFLPGGLEGPASEASPEETLALYDAEIRYVDHHLGRLLEGLDELGVLDELLIIVTSDHGELFGEHGFFGHGLYLTREELHVPLIVRHPRGEAGGRRVSKWVQPVDVLPLILDRLDLSLPPDVQGGCPPDVRHPIVAETYPLPVLSVAGDWLALYEDGYKFLWNSKGSHLLFDLERDPGEVDNLVRSQPDRLSRMSRRLRDYLASLPGPPEGEGQGTVDEETRKALRNLGYIQ